MAKSIRNLLVVLGAVALLFGAANLYAGNTYAANLTGGQYTYVINGEEVTFALDPIAQKSGLLVPVEVFEHFGITVEGTLTRQISLKKADLVTVGLTLGSTTALLDGKPIALGSVPVRLNGRLFLPAELFKHFGVEIAQDGNYVMMHTYVDGAADVIRYPQAEFERLKAAHLEIGSIRADSGVYMHAELTMLTPELLAAQQLDLPYGVRARLQSLAETNTLFLVKLINNSSKAGGMVTDTTYLVDDLRNQYDLAQVLDMGPGLLTSKLAPGAARTGVLMYPRLADDASSLAFWYDSGNAQLGTFYLK